MAVWRDYEWLVIVGSIVAFAMAWSIGANDVANSFATSVGSKSITIFQAVLIATVCEFLGAMLLGGQVVKTIAGGIADVNAFVEDPEFLAYGMLCALCGAAIWVTIATFNGLAVSTTHATVGGIMGFALVYKGKDAVIWYQKAVVVDNEQEYNEAKSRSNYIVGSDQIPIRGLVPIIISWFTSPVCAAFIAVLHFFLVRTLVLRRKNAVRYSYWALPIVVFYAIFMNTFFVVYKGGKTGICTKGTNGAAQGARYSSTLCKNDVTGSPTVVPNAAAWIAAAVAGGVTLLVIIFIVPFVVRHSNTLDSSGAAIKQMDDNLKAEGMGPSMPASPIKAEHMPGKAEHMPGAPEVPPPNRPFYLKAYDTLSYGMRYDIHAAVADDKRVTAIHEGAERFDARAEMSFRPVQVFTSACVSFAHGANDVANAVGPLAAIYSVYKVRAALSSADLPTWILAIGASGIVVGLATFGYNIMRVLGTEMVMLTPSRGFCAELSTAVVISVGSLYGFPLSTTHCQTGSTIGLGLMEGGLRGVNWVLVGKQVIGWVLTLIVAGLISAALFAQAVYAPSVIGSRDVQRYEQMSIDLTRELVLNGMGPTYDLIRRDLAGRRLNAAIEGATYSEEFVTSYLQPARDTLSTGKKTLFQNITLSNGRKKLQRAPVISSIFLTRFVNRTVQGYKDSSVLTFGSPFSKGAGWDKAAYRAQRGSDFANVA